MRSFLGTRLLSSQAILAYRADEIKAGVSFESGSVIPGASSLLLPPDPRAAMAATTGRRVGYLPTREEGIRAELKRDFAKPGFYQYYAAGDAWRNLLARYPATGIGREMNLQLGQGHYPVLYLDRTCFLWHLFEEGAFPLRLKEEFAELLGKGQRNFLQLGEKTKNSLVTWLKTSGACNLPSDAPRAIWLCYMLGASDKELNDILFEVNEGFRFSRRERREKLEGDFETKDGGELSPGDLEQAGELYQKTFGSASSVLTDDIKGRGIRLLLLKREGWVVAIATLRKKGIIVSLSNCAVAEGQRGRGIGERLVEEALKYAQAEWSGLCAAELEVWGDNLRAVALYNRCGFRTTIIGHIENTMAKVL